MKKLLLFLTVTFLLLLPGITRAQCAAGYSQATLNWDYLDYFVYSGNYVSPQYLPSNALSRTQNFAFGLNRLTIAHNFADANSLGENTTHTGETGSFGTGADINFNGNGTITFTFESDVLGLQFSIYDLDNSQSLSVTAKNLANANQNINMTKANAAATHVIVGSGTTAPSVTSLVVGNPATNSNLGTINIDIPTGCNSVTLSFGGTAGDFWISDITACTAGSFPNNYYAVSKPFTGQPGYILHAFDKSVYAINPANGVTKFLFTDPTSLGSSTFINSMAYDPYKRILYYVYSLTATPASNRILMKYDVNTETYTTLLADINTIGIPTTNFSGIESGAAAFYNGSLYLGIETPNSGRTSGRESVIWRIDFDASNNPYRACQVFAVPADNGSGTLMHDWSDFAITNGVLYDFDGAGTTTQTDIYQMNLMTGAVTNFPLPAGYTPGQPAIDWNNRVWQMHAINPGTNPYIALYNPATGTIGARTNITSVPMYTPAIPSLGDGAEAYRPLCDFGDSPASYDPAAGDPAVHELDPLLYLGSSESKEWLQRGQTALADQDNFDDALGTVSTFNPLLGKYLVQATVFNNTGANATMIAWLDYNGNGVFDASEALSYNVPSSASPQSIWIYWNGISSPIPNGSVTYLRIRLTSAANGMTTSNATGFFLNGEVEDYRVLVNQFALSTQLVSFDAQKVNNKEVKLDWNTSGDQAGTKYELERSSNSQDWTSIHMKNGAGTGSVTYTYTDNQPLKGNSYYRLKTINPDNTFTYSQIRMVNFETPITLVVAPNPASNVIKAIINAERRMNAVVSIVDVSGRKVYEHTYTVEPGMESIKIDVRNLTNGIYTVNAQLDNKILNQKLVIKK